MQKVPGWKAISQATLYCIATISTQNTRGTRRSFRVNVKRNRSGEQRSVSRRRDKFLSLWEKLPASLSRENERAHTRGSCNFARVFTITLVIRTRREYRRPAADHHRGTAFHVDVKRRRRRLACLISVRNRVRDCAPAGQTRSIKSRRN